MHKIVTLITNERVVALGILTVEQAKDEGLIPVEWKEIVPNKCTCGKNNMITSNRKRMFCEDVRCPNKVADRMANMLQKLGIKGIGIEYCKAYVHKNKSKTHMEILTCSEDRFPESSYKLSFLHRIREAKQQPRTFGEVASMMCLPGLGTKAIALFKGFSKWESVIETMQKEYGGSDYDLQFVGKRLGGSEQVYTITDTIRAFNLELGIIDKLFNIIDDAKKQYKVAITGSLSLGISREQFPEYIRTLTANQVSITISKAFATVDYVIADSPSSSRTYIEGKARNKLITSEAFIDIIKRGLPDKEENEDGRQQAKPII